MIKMAKKKQNKKSKKNKTSKRKKIDKQEKQIRAIIGVLAFIFFLVFLFIIISNISRSFTWEELRFEKRKMGDIIFYNTELPIWYENGEPTNKMEQSFRNDPRKLEKIPIEGDIELKENIALAFKDGFSCPRTNLATMVLQINFFGRLKNNVFFSGMIEKTLEEQNISCESDNYNILIIKESDETKIVRDGNCYRLLVNDCEIVEISERFMLGWHETNLKLKNN